MYIFHELCYNSSMKKQIVLLLILTTILLAAGCTGNAAKKQAAQSETVSDEAVIDDALASSIETILSDKEYYPDITAIEVSPDYTLFTITLEADVMNMYESMLVMSFYTAGNERQQANGVAEADALTVVRYVNGATNEVISESDSSSMTTQ